MELHPACQPSWGWCWGAFECRLSCCWRMAAEGNLVRMVLCLWRLGRGTGWIHNWIAPIEVWFYRWHPCVSILWILGELTLCCAGSVIECSSKKGFRLLSSSAARRIFVYMMPVSLLQLLLECTEAFCMLGTRMFAKPMLKLYPRGRCNYTSNYIHRVESMQRRAARFVTGQHQWHISLTALIQELQWRSLQERCLTARLCMYYKAVNGHATSDTPERVTTTQRRTRTTHNLKHTVPCTNSDSYRVSFFTRTSRSGTFSQQPL